MIFYVGVRYDPHSAMIFYRGARYDPHSATIFYVGARYDPHFDVFFQGRAQTCHRKSISQMTGAKTVTGLLRRKKWRKTVTVLTYLHTMDGVGGILHQLVEMAL